MNPLRLIVTALFFSAMWLMWQTLQQNRTPVSNKVNQASATPDFVAVDLHQTVFNEQGKRTQRLSAQKMTYYKTIDKAEFESVVMVLQSSENKGRWQISSDSGILYNNQRLLLEQNVNAENLTLSDPIERIVGEQVYINSQDSTMKSDHPVTLYGDGVKIEGSGMTADLNEEKIELVKHAKTIYHRDHK
jgi:lipopolysaccharide export system protein LptC